MPLAVRECIRTAGGAPENCSGVLQQPPLDPWNLRSTLGNTMRYHLKRAMEEKPAWISQETYVRKDIMPALRAFDEPIVIGNMPLVGELRGRLIGEMLEGRISSWMMLGRAENIGEVLPLRMDLTDELSVLKLSSIGLGLRGLIRAEVRAPVRFSVESYGTAAAFEDIVLATMEVETRVRVNVTIGDFLLERRGPRGVVGCGIGHVNVSLGVELLRTSTTLKELNLESCSVASFDVCNRMQILIVPLLDNEIHKMAASEVGDKVKNEEAMMEAQLRNESYTEIDKWEVNLICFLIGGGCDGQSLEDFASDVVTFGWCLWIYFFIVIAYLIVVSVFFFRGRLKAKTAPAKLSTVFPSEAPASSVYGRPCYTAEATPA